MQCLVNTADESELPSQTVTVFAWSSKKYVVLRYPDGRLRVFCSNSRSFSSSAAFSWSNWEQYLLELIVRRSEVAHNKGLPSNPTIYTTSPSLDEDWPLVWLVVVHFACLTISSIPHCCTASTFHCPSQFVLKTERFHYV